MQAAISDHVPYARRGRAIGISELSWSAAWLVGVPSAGWLIARVGWQSPFAVVAMLGIAGLLLIAWVLPHDVPAAGHANNASLQLGQVVRNRNLMAVLCAASFMILANEVTFIVYGAWMDSRFGLSVESLGMASIVIGLAEAAGEFGSTALADRLGKRRAVLVGLVVLGISYAVLPRLGQRLEWALGGLALLFAAFEFTLVSSLPLISELAPEARATAMSVNVAAMTSARMIGSAGGAALFARVGQLDLNAAVSVIASAVAFCVLWFFVHDVRQGTLRA
jgi:predicted MFS family arabinose efflux permease